MDKRRYFAIFGLITLFFFILASSLEAEFDQTRKMKAEAQYRFEQGEYYKAIDIWAEVLKIDSYDKEALGGITKAQEIIAEDRTEEKRAQRQKLNELIWRGKNYHRDREYKQALSVWGEALSIDPTNKEILDLIEEARIRAQYQITILDKLDKEKRLKTPHVGDLEKIANKMVDLLEKADVKVRSEKKEAIEKEVEEELRVLVEEVIEEEPVSIVEEQEELIRKEPEKQEEEKKQEKEKEAEVISEKIKQEKGLIREKERKIEKTEKFPSRQDWLIIGIIFLLSLLLTIKIKSRTKIKPHFAKAPPRRTKKEEDFQPRDLKKFLDKNKEEDKDLFK